MKTIPLREIINTKGKHEIGVSAYNSYGEGPQAIASVDITGIPFTIDTEEVSITDVNGNPLTEILSCGQTIVATVNVDNKQLPDEISINGVEFDYNRDANGTTANITLTNIQNEVNFIFGDLVDIPVSTTHVELIASYNDANSVGLDFYGKYDIASTGTFADLVQQDEQLFIEDNCIYIANDNGKYQLVNGDLRTPIYASDPIEWKGRFKKVESYKLIVKLRASSVSNGYLYLTPVPFNSTWETLVEASKDDFGKVIVSENNRPGIITVQFDSNKNPIYSDDGSFQYGFCPIVVSSSNEPVYITDTIQEVTYKVNDIV